jgi:transposase
MIYLTAQSQILLAIKPVDFRKQIDGLVAVCKGQLAQQPKAGHLFVFINKSRTMVRILCYEHNGYWLATKRLSQGRYEWPRAEQSIYSLAAQDLKKLLKCTLASVVPSV